MPPEKNDAAYLWDMVDAARAVHGFVSGRSFAEYDSDRMPRGQSSVTSRSSVRRRGAFRQSCSQSIQKFLGQGSLGKDTCSLMTMATSNTSVSGAWQPK